MLLISFSLVSHLLVCLYRGVHGCLLKTCIIISNAIVNLVLMPSLFSLNYTYSVGVNLKVKALQSKTRV